MRRPAAAGFPRRRLPRLRPADRRLHDGRQLNYVWKELSLDRLNNQTDGTMSLSGQKMAHAPRLREFIISYDAPSFADSSAAGMLTGAAARLR